MPMATKAMELLHHDSMIFMIPFGSVAAMLTDQESKAGLAGAFPSKAGQHQAEPVQLEFLKDIFGLSDAFLASCPGIISYYDHGEALFQRAIRHRVGSVQRFVQHEKSKGIIAFREWSSLVLAALRSLEGAQTSIDNIFQHMASANKMSAGSFKPDEKKDIYIVIFSTLCWLTMTLTPSEPSSSVHPKASEKDPGCFIVKDANGTEASQPLEAARRPFSKTLRAFRPRAWVIDPSAETPSGSDLAQVRSKDDLYQSSLNYYSLCTVGRVRLQWVEDLSMHLNFDRQTRCLSVFKFPSFCVAEINRSNRVSLLDEAFKDLLPSVAGQGEITQQMLAREVILSYRLLFGQDRKSRNLAKEHLRHLKDEQGKVDVLLDTLCCTALKGKFHDTSRDIWPTACQDFDGRLLEQDVYSVSDDFRIFGSRLLKVQRYNLRQQPSRVRDLWRDRRNPLQWYTFWAVLWVGGLSILLALLQLLVGIVQLYFGIRAV